MVQTSPTIINHMVATNFHADKLQLSTAQDLANGKATLINPSPETKEQINAVQKEETKFQTFKRMVAKAVAHPSVQTFLTGEDVKTSSEVSPANNAGARKSNPAEAAALQDAQAHAINSANKVTENQFSAHSDVAKEAAKIARSMQERGVTMKTALDQHKNSISPDAIKQNKQSEGPAAHR